MRYEFSVRFDGSKLYLVTPHGTDSAELLESLVSEESTWFGLALVVEDHYIADLVEGLREYGATVYAVDSLDSL